MQISNKQWKQYQRRLSRISEKASAEMSAWIVANGGYQSIQFEAAIAKAYELATKYGEASAALSALMYDTIADLSGAAVPAATVANTATVGEVSKAIYGASSYSQNDDYISGIVGRMVKQAGADTTLQNARRDGAEFAWISVGDSCAFCELLSASGWQRASSETIKGNHASHIHSNCDCQFMVRFNSNTSIQGYNPNTKLYYETEGRTMEEKANTLRRQNYAKNKEKINEQKRIAYQKRTEELNSSSAEESTAGAV